jgi:hypothetical protein
MKGSRFSEEQIIGILREHEAGQRPGDMPLSREAVRPPATRLNLPDAFRITSSLLDLIPNLPAHKRERTADSSVKATSFSTSDLAVLPVFFLPFICHNGGYVGLYSRPALLSRDH